ncbi:transposase, partial [Acidiphilium sp. PA]|uniref:transposase n=1 Tax=Acidiphilium sp. PA TaxID=2871705 RepID=UPI002243F3FF
ARIAQLAAIIPGAVLVRPHQAAPANRAAAMESQVTPKIQGVPGWTLRGSLLQANLHADGGYAGPKLNGRLAKIGKWTIQIDKRSDTASGFELLPRRWVVERTFAWLGRCRRLAKDFETTVTSATAWLFIAHIRLLTRKITRNR